jgi:hypothetical protein
MVQSLKHSENKVLNDISNITEYMSTSECIHTMEIKHVDWDIMFALPGEDYKLRVNSEDQSISKYWYGSYVALLHLFIYYIRDNIHTRSTS